MTEIKDKALHVAVLEAMSPLPCVNPGYCTWNDLAYARSRLEKWQQWIAETDLPDDVRWHYEKWVKYCEYQNARGEEELITERGKKQHQEYLDRQAALSREVAQIVVPKPPQRF